MAFSLTCFIFNSWGKPESAEKTHTRACVHANSCNANKTCRPLHCHAELAPSAPAKDHSTKSSRQSKDTFHFSCNLIVIKVSTKFPHLVLYKEVLVQPSCVCEPQLHSNVTRSSPSQHRTSALVGFPPAVKYSHKSTWSQWVKVVLKRLKSLLSLLSLREQMRRAEMKAAKVLTARRSVQLRQLGPSLI